MNTKDVGQLLLIGAVSFIGAQLAKGVLNRVTQNNNEVIL